MLPLRLCGSYGLAGRRAEGIYCAARKRLLSKETEAGEWFYFMPPVVEDGRPFLRKNTSC